jgi:DNA-binding phage protein
MKEDLIMKSNHIIIAMTVFTVIKVIFAGEKLIAAIQVCFRMRALTNMLFDIGMSPEEIYNTLPQDWKSL